jgi:catechol 2,3-dioxygenase-like lactoylglutathione lyase family enzyme
MDGKLTFIYLPVPDMTAARNFYRDILGFEEAWRQGEDSCAFKLPGTDVQLMLTVTSVNPSARAGAVFHVPSVASFYQERQQDISFAGQPFPIPGFGHWVQAQDGVGNGLYFADAEA